LAKSQLFSSTYRSLTQLFSIAIPRPPPTALIYFLFYQLGLPPRFAGVSLLALGNGAADVSATVSAITSDPQIGYKLALGALTGAAMLISGGTFISGLVD
jgi:Ca2+/Na+ antiporter